MPRAPVAGSCYTAAPVWENYIKVDYSAIGCKDGRWM
jgi:hypothetical protein